VRVGSTDSKFREQIFVVGVGNILLKDEGIGVHVIREMEKLDLPKNVRVIDGGTAGFDLGYLIEGADRLILIDAIDAGCEPGVIFKFRPDDIKAKPKRYFTSAHEVGLLEALEMAKCMGKCPQTVIFGIQPKEIDLGMELSTELKAKIPEIIRLILEEIS